MPYSVWSAVRRRFIPDFGAIPTFARDYLRVLIAEYEGVARERGLSDTPEFAAVKRKTDDRTWEWADVVAVENAILNATGDAEMRSTVVRWRERYRDIVGDTRFANYVQSGPPDVKTAQPAELRADARALAARIHYLLATVTAREKMRNRLSLFLGLVMLGAAMLVLTGALAYQQEMNPFRNSLCAEDTYCVKLSAFEVVMLAGLFGGFVSVQQRLQSATEVDPFFKRLELSAGWGSIVLIAPLMGMVFAIVLFEIFVTGAVGGEFFPKFVTVDQKNVDASTFQSFSVGSTPLSPHDWAKLAVWGFVAGFAERFVPDVVSRLAEMKTLFSETKS